MSHGLYSRCADIVFVVRFGVRPFGRTGSIFTIQGRYHQRMARRTRPRLEYSFPLDSIALKDCRTGGLVEARVVLLTRMLAYWRMHSSWRHFSGPYARDFEVPEDGHWRWVKLVRNFRNMPVARCAALQTPDGHVQGAIIYRRDGASWLEPGEKSVYVEYLASAVWNRPTFAETPSYRGVGEGLVMLAMLHSYEWGMGGRVTLESLPGAAFLYEKMKFVKTGPCRDRMIPFEVTPRIAIAHLIDKGLIDGGAEPAGETA